MREERLVTKALLKQKREQNVKSGEERSALRKKTNRM